ncbi:MAG TPA: TIM barrel protein, partial [Devosia sp.]|nr:TIM barrel protein [Devosia sp.]
DEFGRLCEEARAFGATIGFEFMASAMIHRLDDCLAMVEGAAAPNGGLIVDLAHVMAIGIPFEAVSRIPLRYLVNVELNDNLLPGSPSYDPGQRRFCGEGDFDIRGFIAAVRKTGYAGPWAVEVFADALVALTPEELDRRAHDTTRRMFMG